VILDTPKMFNQLLTQNHDPGGSTHYTDLIIINHDE